MGRVCESVSPPAHQTGDSGEGDRILYILRQTGRAAGDPNPIPELGGLAADR